MSAPVRGTAIVSGLAIATADALARSCDSEISTDRTR